MNSLIVSNDTLFEITDVVKKDAITMPVIMGTPLGDKKAVATNLIQNGIRTPTPDDLIKHLIDKKKGGGSTWFASLLGIDGESYVCAKLVVPSTDIYPLMRLFIDLKFDHISNTYRYTFSAFSIEPKYEHEYTLHKSDEKKGEQAVRSFLHALNELNIRAGLPMFSLKTP